MKNGYMRATGWRWLLSPLVLIMPLVAHGLQHSDVAAGSTSVPRIVLAQAVTVSPASEAYHRGVAFYKDDRYREAQTEFNRALALQSDYEEAKQFLEKCRAKIAVEAAGAEPGAVSVFETYDPESIAAGGESPTLAPDELKRLRVKEYLKYGKLYLENHLYPQAVEIYTHVLQLDRDSKEGKEGLHAASLGQSAEIMEDELRNVEKDSDLISRYIWESKQLPEGADAKGIKNYVFRVPEIEENYEEEHEETKMEMVLRSPVNIEFEDIHIKDVMEFIQDSFELNVVIDKRAVEPEREAVTTTGVPGAFGAPPGGPGAFGAPGVGGGQRARRGGGGGGGGFRARRGGDGGGGGGFGGLRGSAFAGTGTGIGIGQGESQFNVESVNDFYGARSDGMIPYINLKDATLGDALKA
ncbi:MAG: hypothetical protein L3K26_15465, partial [Candidatus Hydrogenedentes bacterium]|nr:hypothetical protein [Candidatus Hydrogenedentota bacterium]